MLMIDDDEADDAIGFHEFTQEYAVYVNGEEFRVSIKVEYIKVPRDFPNDLFALVKEKIMEKIKASNTE
jgi:hypothetical protein